MYQYVFYHKNCSDGFGAAYAAWKALGDEDVVYAAISYNSPVPTVEKGATVTMMDVSLSREDMLTLASRCNLTLLDHHKSAEAVLGDLDFCHFDMEHSGAVLAWNYFHGREVCPYLLEYVEDRDLWRWGLSGSREVSASIQSYPFDFKVWDNFNLNELEVEGAVILRSNSQLVSVMANKATVGNIGGYEVPICNASVLQSELGEELLARFPEYLFVAMYHDASRGARQWSLRANGKIDVGELASRLGVRGGGHPNSSGFTEKPTAIVEVS